jgi:hypothetical protein
VEDDGWCWEKVRCVHLGDLRPFYSPGGGRCPIGDFNWPTVATVQCILIPLIARSVDGVMDVHGCSGHYSIIREGKQAVVGVRIPRGARRLEGACGLRWRRRPIHD